MARRAQEMWLLVLLMVVVSSLAQSWNIQQHLGTQSPYWSEGSTASTPPPSQCSLIHLDLLARHGSRYPTNGDVKHLTALEGLIKQYSASINNSYVKGWTNPYPAVQQGMLALTGQEELFQLGQRFNKTYSAVFSTAYTPDTFVMQSTQVPRTGQSASSFAQGFLQGEGNPNLDGYQPVFVYSDTPSLDYLRFFDNCAQYTDAQENGTISTTEADKYGDIYYPSIAQQVAQRLGVQSVWNITVDELDTIFTACAFEVAVFNKLDGWCPLLAPADIDVYEYASDLEDYWEKAYGSGIGYQISAVLLQSIVAAMDGVINNTLPTQKAYLRFSHAEDVIPLASLLGLFKDATPLYANASAAEIQNRQWWSSIAAPFGSNFAFALYSCGAGDYKVKMTHNEVEYAIPGCDNLFCEYTQFKQLFAQQLAFNFTQACSTGHTTTSDNFTGYPPWAVAVTGVVSALGGCGLAIGIFALLRMSRRSSSAYSRDDDRSARKPLTAA